MKSLIDVKTWFDLGIYLDSLIETSSQRELERVEKFKVAKIGFSDSYDLTYSREWKLFDRFFNQRIERGNQLYNSLIIDYREDVLLYLKELEEFIDRENCNLLYLNDTNSAPINLSLSLALVIISEERNITVISKQSSSLVESMSRFNINSHLGEFFSIIEVISGYSSRRWFHIVESQTAFNSLVKESGVNPASISIGGKLKDIKKIIRRKSKTADGFANSTLDNYIENLKSRESELSDLLNLERYNLSVGYSPMRFLFYLKSLIDPSYFRVEEAHQRGYAYKFLLSRVSNQALESEQRERLFNAVERLFLYQSGEVPIRIDFSFEYRHRNRIDYPYRKLSQQEFTGVLMELYNETIGDYKVNSTKHYQKANNPLKWANLKIDHKDELKTILSENKPLIIDLSEDPFSGIKLLKFAQKKREKSKEKIDIFIKRESYKSLKPLLKEFKNINLIKIDQKSVGFDIRLLGEKGTQSIKKCSENGGYLITFGENSAVTTDTIDINRFHIGLVESEIFSKMMGIEINEKFIQYVPAGERFCIAYPTPIETGLSFSQKLKENRVDEVNGEINGVEFRNISGRYSDSLPWSGVFAKVKESLSYKIVSAEKRQPLSLFVDSFKESNQTPKIAWNGGFILNDELVGKLGLGEEYISSPLGLIIENSRVLSAPLFNRPALLIDREKKIQIQRVNSSGGLRVYKNGSRVFNFNPKGYNNYKPFHTQYTYYDLMGESKTVNAQGRVLVQLAGNRVKHIYRDVDEVEIKPVGLLLSFPAVRFPKEWELEDSLEIRLFDFLEIDSGIEAGPLLLSEAQDSIDMEFEGWNRDFSISTQAGRLDYLDMRGPKIAIGVDTEGNLLALVVNARVRESVGATHIEMMEIMKQNGAVDAMGFDPGGSATLIVGDRVLNISPYNIRYESSPLSLPPEPRAVSNGIIGY